MRKNVQISETLFHSLLKYHLLDLRDPGLELRIKEDLQIKLDSLIRHQLYTQSKTAATSEEREAFKQKYLEAAGIMSDWQT